MLNIVDTKPIYHLYKEKEWMVAMLKNDALGKVNSNNKNRKSKKKSKTAPIIITVTTIIIIVIIIIIVVNYGKTAEVANNVVITEDNAEEIAGNNEEVPNLGHGSYEVNMNYDWTFDSSTGESSDAYIGNSTSNTSTVYATLTLDDSEEVIYKSPYIPVGSHIEKIKLDKIPDKGKYNGVLKYHLVDGNYEEMSNVSVAVTVTIRK